MKKKVLLMVACVAAMLAVGTGLKAQEVTVPLLPGWTWISYPGAVPVDIATAFGSFTPLEGDVIESQFGMVSYVDGGWLGDFDQFYPGYGYMYYSTRMVPVTVTMGEPLPFEAVSTAEPSDVTATSATVGGTVSVGEGNHVFVRGVCWGTEGMPNVDGSHATGTAEAGSQTILLDGLTPGTTYYVRAYMVTDHGLAYGEAVSFTTEAGSSGGGDHAYVDLGLPSGLLWATCNVGADNPEDYGDYFAWGETQPKSYYDWSTYQYCNGDYNLLTKYCNKSNYSYNGFTDNLTTLLPEDDAATANWGSGWRMPTKEEWQELYQNTTNTWTTQNGVNGRLFTAANGNSLFLPAAGCRGNSSLYDAGSSGYYWSSSLDTGYPDGAWDFLFSSGGYLVSGNYRNYGQSVRGVRSSRQN